MTDRCMEDGERETLAHAATELRELAAKTQWITERTPLPGSRFDQSDMFAVAIGAEDAAIWIDALLRHGYWGTPNPVQSPPRGLLRPHRSDHEPA